LIDFLADDLVVLCFVVLRFDTRDFLCEVAFFGAVADIVDALGVVGATAGVFGAGAGVAPPDGAAIAPPAGACAFIIMPVTLASVTNAIAVRNVFIEGS
jgi:hypothetical protein